MSPRAIAAALAIACVLAGCAPAQTPNNVLATVEQVVIADLVAGKTLAQVEQDVARALGGSPAADVTMVVQDVLAVLIDTGVLPPSLLPLASQYRAIEAMTARMGHK